MNDVGIGMSIRSQFRCWGLLGLVSLVSLAGCGGADESFSTAKVSGKVMLDGKPVEGGDLIFAPIAADKDKKPGKSGVASVGMDGTYVVSTYAKGDGAVVGKHKVTFNPSTAGAPPVVDPSAAHVEARVNPYAGVEPKQSEVTVVKGTNTIDIELVKATAPANTPPAN